MPRGAVVTDYGDSVLIPSAIVDHTNEEIRKLGGEKVCGHFGVSANPPRLVQLACSLVRYEIPYTVIVGELSCGTEIIHRGGGLLSCVGSQRWLMVPCDLKSRGGLLRPFPVYPPQRFFETGNCFEAAHLSTSTMP